MMNSQNHSSVSPSPATASPPAAPAPTIVVYPTVSPQTVIIPIISSITVFPAVALTVICCLRYRAKRARRSAKRPRLGDKTERTIPAIRVDGSRKLDLGMKEAKTRKRDSRHTNELHYTSATVFQAVLGIDLDLDERSEWENEVMGYTSVKVLTSPTSSVGSVQVRPAPNSIQSQIIQMEMSPRVVRSPRPSPAAPGDSVLPLGRPDSAPIGRQPDQLLQRNGHPPGSLPQPTSAEPADGASAKTHGRLHDDEIPERLPELNKSRPPPEPREPSAQTDSELQKIGKSPGHGKAEDCRVEISDFWKEPFKFIDDSSEAS